MYFLLQLRFIIAMIWTDSLLKYKENEVSLGYLLQLIICLSFFIAFIYPMTKRKRNQPLDLEVTIHHNS